jgi:hypothetical protein
VEQPQWFYSSLAQVTAAIVGFVGGFLLLRLLEVIRDWSGLVDRLRERQTRWARADHRERAYDQVHELKLGPFTGERLELSNDESETWSDLYETIQEQRATKMPTDLLWSLGLVTLIAFAFALGPLLALDHPSFYERLIWLAGLATALGALVALLRAAVRARYKALQEFELYPHTKARLEDYELQIEGMLERDREEKAQREGGKADENADDS